MSPATPSTVRRSLRLLETPTKVPSETPVKPRPTPKRKCAAPSPKTPIQSEPKRQRRQPKKRAVMVECDGNGGNICIVKDAICNDQCPGRCLYIHGVPGTGKTMSVLAVMRRLRSELESGNLRPYCFIEINGLKLASPENIYKAIYEQLSGHRVLYNILDWPTRPNSNLVVIGIANTMDLPEKLLPRISSRMGIRRLCFGPYNYRQLQEIITSRLKGIAAFEEQAIEFASRKVAAMSGDARRALEICRRAARVCRLPIKQSGHTSMNRGKNVVSMGDIEAAIQEVFLAPHIQVMKNCPKFGKIILVAMVHELYKSGLGEVTIDKLAATVISWCHANRELLPGYDTLLKICCKLGESKIILCEEGTKHKLQKLQLNYPRLNIGYIFPHKLVDFYSNRTTREKEANNSGMEQEAVARNRKVVLREYISRAPREDDMALLELSSPFNEAYSTCTRGLVIQPPLVRDLDGSLGHPSRSKSKHIAASAMAQMDLSTPSKATSRRKPKMVASPSPMSLATPFNFRRSLRLLETPTKVPSETPVKPRPTPKRKRAIVIKALRRGEAVEYHLLA
ncbi:hypothetical protein GUJ93_ZPchr0001g32769 [Zizania palustris]|uniref:Origin recognition complex subunit 1 n=1 Tax=Zizania palustris TaxID=103762 RepID=A0A8J5R9B0_ZIZPA|nr:hypothetical protein GUJ93_ZPchr0001g32769 [Zizania palustris]